MRRPGHSHWTSAEIKVLEKHYPELGPTRIEAKLPGRSHSAIYTKASDLGLKAPPADRSTRRKYNFTPEMDAKILEVYQGNVTRGMIEALARRLKLPRWRVGYRARSLGLVTPRFKEPNWTPEETALLEAHATKLPSTIKQIFARQGFTRSEASIVIRRKRLQLEINDRDNMSANAFAKILGVDPHWVTAHIQDRTLKAGKRGTKRKAQQGGDSYVIELAVARDFVLKNLASIDIRKVEKFTFVSLLTGEVL